MHRLARPLLPRFGEDGMRVLSAAVSILSLFSCSLAKPVRHAQRRPLVIWHGLGDSYGSPGMLEFIELIKGVHPGLFVHSVRLAESQEDDKKAGFVSVYKLADALLSAY